MFIIIIYKYVIICYHYQENNCVSDFYYSQIKQIKSMTEKMGSVIEGKKKSEWWKVYMCNLYFLSLYFFLIFIYIAICGRWS